MELRTKLRIFFKKRSYPSSTAVDKFLRAVMERGEVTWYPHNFDTINVELDGRRFWLFLDPTAPWNGCSRCSQEKSFDDGSIDTRILWDWMRPSRRMLLRFCIWLESQGIDKFKSRKSRLADDIERVLSTTAEDDD